MPARTNCPSAAEASVNDGGHGICMHERRQETPNRNAPPLVTSGPVQFHQSRAMASSSSSTSTLRHEKDDDMIARSVRPSRNNAITGRYLIINALPKHIHMSYTHKIEMCAIAGREEEKKFGQINFLMPASPL